MPDELLVFEGAGGARLAVCRADHLSREAALRHGLAPGSAAVLAQALTGTLLVADLEPEPEPSSPGQVGAGIGSDADASSSDRTARDNPSTRVDLHLTCRGPLKGLLTDADARGAVRGLVRVGSLARDGKPAGEGGTSEAANETTRFDPRPLLATRHDEEAGSLSILRAAAGSDDLHRTAFPFAGADLGAALTLYLRNDRQGGGEMALEVSFREGAPLAAVGGVLLSADRDFADDRPGREERDLSALGKPLRQRILRDCLRPEDDARALADRIAAELSLGPLRLRTEMRPRFSCRCSRQRVERALRVLGPVELRDMAERDGGAEARCDFCATTYRLSRQDLLALAAAV